MVWAFWPGVLYTETQSSGVLHQVSPMFGIAPGVAFWQLTKQQARGRLASVFGSTWQVDQIIHRTQRELGCLMLSPKSFAD